MTDQTPEAKAPVDIEVTNERFNIARVKRKEKEARLAREREEEEARLVEEREERLTEQAAEVRDQLFETFNGVDLRDAAGVDLVMTSFAQCQQILSGEQPTSARAPASMPAPSRASNFPFNWDQLDSNQQKSILLIAQNKGRFFVKPSGALGDREGKRLDTEQREAREAAEAASADSNATTEEADDSDASAPVTAPKSAASPLDMPSKNRAAIEAAAKPDTEVPAQKSGDDAKETSSGPKKSSIWGNLREAGKNFMNEPVKSVKDGIKHLD